MSQTETLITLPCGLQVRKRKLSGRDFFRFQSLAAKNAMEAAEWFILNAFEWSNGERITTDDLDSDGTLGFDDVLFLNSQATKNFTQSPQQET